MFRYWMLTLVYAGFPELAEKEVALDADSDNR
jgi:hypothetical protein